jgi:hypothetical protein
MSLTWGSGRGSEPQSGIDKGIRAGCVVGTTSDNASMTQLQRPVSYAVDTQIGLQIAADMAPQMAIRSATER